MTTIPTPVRGEVWRIRFDPAESDEIKKVLHCHEGPVLQRR